MKKLLSLFIFALLLALAVSAETLNGTKVRSGVADPQLFTDGEHYYLAKTGNTRIAVYTADSISGLASASDEESIAYTAYYDGIVYDPTVETLFGEGATVNGTWSPEIHYFSEEDFGEEHAGWYMFVGLRMTPEANSQYTSEFVRLVVLKALTDDPAGPYGHPVTGVQDFSQPLLDKNGNIYDEWACGQTVLRIPEGEYAGIYTLWVDEVGRGTSDFYQRIRISKMSNPWTLSGTPGTVTRPTQDWEYVGSEDGKHAAVVEGATPVYGKNGEIFLTYSGSGYWTNYGIGQLTWNGGNPLNMSSWVKYAGNPIFTATTARDLRGAGHASFLTDTEGNGFFCYHAYTYSVLNGKGSSRAAYIEPYSIDYSANNGVGKGLIKLGNGVAARTSTAVTFALDGEALKLPEVYTLGKTFSIKLTIMDSNAEGYILYRSEDGEVFDYLTTVGGTSYTDYDVVKDNTYTYRVYPYRAEEISEALVEVSQKATTCSPHTLSATAENETVTVEVYANDNYDKVRLYRSADGVQFGTGIQEVENVRFGETVVFTDTVPEVGTYEYMATGINGGFEYFASTVSVTVEYVTPAVAAPTISNVKQTLSERVGLEITANADYDGGIRIYHSEDGVTFEQLDFTMYNIPVSEGSMLRLPIVRLSAGTHYFYAVGIANGVESAPSEVRSFDVVSLRAPVFTEITATCEGITMTYGGEEAYDGYTIYRFGPGTDEYFGEYLESQEIATTAETTYTLTDITIGEEYLFGVRGTVNGVATATSTAAFRVTPAHTVEEAEGLAPTCTEAGYTKSATCSVCAEILLAKDPIPATDHNHVLIAEEIPATYESEGKTAVYECTVCGDSYGGDVIPKLYEAGSGDANGDGKISLTDAIRILHMIRDDAFATEADLSADGEITVLDALLLLQKIVDGGV